MARLVTSGFEMNRVGTSGLEPDGFFNPGTGVASISSAVKRSGAFAAQCSSGAGNNDVSVAFTQTYVLSTNYFLRAYLCFDSLPAATVRVMALGLAGTNGVSIRLTSAGVLQVFDEQHNTQIGSDSVGTVTADGATFYRFELQMNVDASTHASAATGVFDGTQFATGSISTTVALTNTLVIGWVNQPGATKTVYVDDVALNDSTGGSQNTFPGSGNVVLLIPTATSAAGTGWRLGTNTAEGGNGWNSVNNEPPVGVADLAVGSDPKQIRNATANANDSFDTTMTTYTAAGVGAGATVNVVDPIIATAAPVSTAAKTGTVGVVSNPVIANIDLSDVGATNAFWSGTTAGTYLTGWKWSHGTATYAPSVTLGTAPVMRVTQVTSSTRIAMVCFMGMYIDYTPAAATGVAPPERVALQAVTRSTVW